MELFVANLSCTIETKNLRLMKKLLYIFAFLSFTGLGINQAQAQEVNTNSELGKKELKAEAKIAKSKVNLEKAKAKLTKLQTKYEKKRQSFAKKNSQGKLSPNDVAKQSKALESMSSKIDKEKKNIEKLEEFLRLNGTL